MVSNDLDASPERRPRKDWRIGIIGAGFIVSECHLPAYQKAGFHVSALAARRRNAAASLADRFNVGRIFDDATALLDSPDVDVLDVAVPPAAQAAIIFAACARGHIKGILAQKPLGLNYAQALELVQACDRARIVLAVNQNMRHDPSVRAAAQLLSTGALGEPVFATIDMRAIPHWMPWQRELGWVTLRILSIHHLDCFRYWFGDPERIFCSVRTDPRTAFPHSDGLATYILEYASGLRCVGIDDTWTGPAREGCPADFRIHWRIEGLGGLAMGDIGWCKNPYTTPSTLRWAKKGDERFRDEEFSRSWFPDAFAGTMGDLLVALEAGAEPAISGRDNLKTMALVDAAYRSASIRQAVSLSYQG